MASQDEDVSLLTGVAKLLQGPHLHSQSPFNQLVTVASDLKNLQGIHARCLEERLDQELVGKTEVHVYYFNHLNCHLFYFR